MRTGVGTPALRFVLAATLAACGGGGSAAPPPPPSDGGIPPGADGSVPPGVDGAVPDANMPVVGDGAVASNPGLDVCSATSGALAWTAFVPGSSTGIVDVAAGPTSDVVLADLAGGNTLEQRRWSKTGAVVSTHQDPAGAYAGPMFPSTLAINPQNDAFYGLMLTGMPMSGGATGAKLTFTLLTPAGTTSFVVPTTKTITASGGSPAVTLFHAGFDSGGGLHAPLTVPAASAQYFGTGVYCYGSNGSFAGASAANAIDPLSSQDSVWVSTANNLWVARTVTATTDFGCGTPLTVPSGGGTALVMFNGGGGCISNALLALPTAAVKERAFRIGEDGSLLLAVIYSGTIDFGGGSMTSTGSSSLAVARFDAMGKLVLAKSFGSAGASFHSVSIAGSSTGTIALVGGFSGSVDLGGGALPQTGDTFVASLDTTLHAKWSKVVTVGQGALVATAGPCGLILATTSSTVDLGTGPLSNGAGIGVAALAL
jgi:hypothetical protein